MTPITYIPNFWELPNLTFDSLLNEVAWERREGTPRSEYYSSMNGKPYTYGRGAGVRTYQSKPWHPMVLDIKHKIEKFANTTFDVCFLNAYKDGFDHLGWHSDNSPEMDDDRPIAIVSLGAEREIWFQPIEFEKRLITPHKLKLEHGSLCLMHPGMQDTHQHRIPKADYQPCGPRISMTFRGFVEPR
jgi:alkylated DNA repair dioxygenase AlkB